MARAQKEREKEKRSWERRSSPAGCSNALLLLGPVRRKKEERKGRKSKSTRCALLAASRGRVSTSSPIDGLTTKEKKEKGKREGKPAMGRCSCTDPLLASRLSHPSIAVSRARTEKERREEKETASIATARRWIVERSQLPLESCVSLDLMHAAEKKKRGEERLARIPRCERGESPFRVPLSAEFPRSVRGRSE